MTDLNIIEAIADALDAASAVLRRRLREAVASAEPSQSGHVLDAVMREHHGLGPRQRQVIDLVAQHGERGVDTGWLFRAMGYDQANLYLVLRSLVQRGIVEKQSDHHPHLYRLAAKYR